MTILLVEDDEALRGAFKDVLEFFGYQVHDAASGPQALELLRAEPKKVDLVISDLVMPYMNALELYEALQEVQQQVRMLIVTGYPMPQTGMTLVERPGVRWASKPIRMEALEELVRQMVGDKGG